MPSASSDLIKIRAYYMYCMFPKAPNILGMGNNTYGITNFEIVEVLEGSPVKNRNYSVTITGEFFEPLKKGVIYTILAKQVIHPVYGVQYNLIYINEQVDLNKLTNQKAFLSSFLTKGQIAELYKVHENPLTIIAAHDIEGLKQVHGIGDYIANCIIERFEANKDMSRIYVELNDYGLTPNFIRKLIKTYRSPNALIDIVKNHPYQLTYDVEGVGFKTADEIALRGGISPKDVKRVGAYIRYFLETEALEHGNSYVTAGELLSNIHAFFGGQDNIVEDIYDENGESVGTNISVAITELQESNILVVEEGENKSRRRVYLTYYYNLEKEIAYHLKRLLKSDNNFKYDNWMSQVSLLEEKQGFAFDETQIKGIKLGLDSQVCIITGGAGCGKSSLVAGILAGLEEYSFAQTSLSGKAAARLQEVTGVEGKTIHRLLEYAPGIGFAKDEKNPLTEDIIVLDEISMVGGEIFLSLLKAIPDGTKLIMCGDVNQLESIGALNLANDMLKSHIIPSTELTVVHRQAAKSGILTIANEVRQQHSFFDNHFEGRKKLGELEDMLIDISSERNDTLERSIQHYKNLFNSNLVKRDVMSIQLLAPVKERGDACVYNLNIEAQKIVNPLPDDYDENEVFQGGTDEKPFFIHKNDKVMCIKNNYRVFTVSHKECAIFNGWTGIVKDIKDGYLRIHFPLNEEDVVMDYDTASNSIILGYASTTHKYQGSEVPIVIGVLDYTCPPSMLTRQWLYTMITRAKKMCMLVGQNAAINKAIATDYISTKRTFLQELLNN